jgi:hypothetical protein
LPRTVSCTAVTGLFAFRLESVLAASHKVEGTPMNRIGTKGRFGLVLVAIVFGVSCSKATVGTAGVRTDGLYQTGSGGDQGYGYLRFYSDGSVLSVTSTGTPEQVAKWLKKGKEWVGEGKADIQGANIKFSSSTKEGTVDYEGTVQVNALAMRSYSHINEYRAENQYKFVHVPVD